MNKISHWLMKNKKMAFAGLIVVSLITSNVLSSDAQATGVHVTRVVAVHNTTPTNTGTTSMSQTDDVKAIAMTTPQLAAALSAGTVREGYGYKIYLSDGSYDFVGWYWVKDPSTRKWYRAYCVNPHKGLNSGQHFTDVRRLSGHSKTAFEEIDYTLVRVGTPNSSPSSAAASQVINGFYGNKADVVTRAKSLSKTVHARTALFTSNAIKYHGKPRLTRSCTVVLSGQQGSCTFSLVSTSTKRGLPGVRINLQATNATIPSHVTTNAQGKRTFGYTKKPGSTTITAISIQLPRGQIYKSNPAAGQQLLLAPNGVAVKTMITFSMVPKATGSYNCTTECNGNPVVTYNLCHAVNETTLQAVETDNGKAVASKVLTKGSRAFCADIKHTVPDAHTAGLKCRYEVSNGHWSAYFNCGTTIQVDCPAWPTLAFSGSTSCKETDLVVWLPLNSAGTDERLLVNGKVVYTTHKGETGAKYTVTVLCGSTTTVGVAIQRRHHSDWNGGNVLTIGAQAA